MPNPSTDLPRFPNGEVVTRADLRRLSERLGATAGDFASVYKYGGSTTGGEAFTMNIFPAIVGAPYFDSEGQQKASARYNMTRGITKSKFTTPENPAGNPVRNTDLWQLDNDNIPGIAMSFIATNYAETDDSQNAFSNNVPQGQDVICFAFWNRSIATPGQGNQTPQTTYTGIPLYVFYWKPKEIAWVKITTAMPYASSPNGGGGWYNCTILKGSPTDLNPTFDVVIPDTGETVSADDAGLAQNTAEANLGNPAVGWVPREEWVLATYIGMSAEATPRPTYRFDYPRQVYTLKIITPQGSVGGGGSGSYLAYVGQGRVSVAQNANFRVPDPNQVFAGPAVIWRNLDEAGAANDGSNTIASNTLVFGYLEGYDSSMPAQAIYYGTAEPSGTTFLCNLTLNGGTDGNATAPATWGYDGTTQVGGNYLFTAQSPLVARPNGRASQANYGLAYIKGDSTIGLAQAYEIYEGISIIACTISSDGGSDGTMTAPPTYTYTGNTIGGLSIGTHIAVTASRTNGSYTPASNGMGYFNGATFVLLWVDEIADTSSC